MWENFSMAMDSLEDIDDEKQFKNALELVKINFKYHNEISKNSI